MSNNADNKLADAIRAAFHDDRFTVDAGSGRVWLGMKFDRPAGKFTKAGFSTASTSGFARDDKRKRVTESDVLAWLGQAEVHLRAELPKYNEASAAQARELLGELEAHWKHRS